MFEKALKQVERSTMLYAQSKRLTMMLLNSKIVPEVCLQPCILTQNSRPYFRTYHMPPNVANLRFWKI